MFKLTGLEAFKRALNSVSNKHMEIEFRIPEDNEGYIDRKCPSSKCGTFFKVSSLDWREKCRNKIEKCPRCGYNGSSQDFHTPRLRKHIGKLAVDKIRRELRTAMQHKAPLMRREQVIGDFVTISWHYKPSHPKVHLPIKAYDTIQQKIECNSCGVRFAIIGAAFFCPSCTANFAITEFFNNIDRITNNLELISSLYREMSDIDYYQFKRIYLENSLIQLVMDFQFYSKTIFSKLPNSSAINLRKNVFQRLKDSSKLWKQLTGNSYEDMIDTRQLAELCNFFQQRHLLEHNGGIVDQEYINKTGDTTYEVKQRLVINEDNIRRMATLIKILGRKIYNIYINYNL